MNWFVYRDPRSGKYADGSFGFDADICEDCQIFAEDCLPYGESPGNILVASGEKPSVEDVRDILRGIEYRAWLATQRGEVVIPREFVKKDLTPMEDFEILYPSPFDNLED